MAKLKQNAFLSFVGIVLATVLLLALPAAFEGRSSVCDRSSYATVYWQTSSDIATQSDDCGWNQASDPFFGDPLSRSTAAFWGNCRPISQMSLRSQRGSLVYGFGGRDGGLFKFIGLRVIKKISLPYHQNAGFPTPLSYRIPKEYYVFTLKRILC